jgi:two-component system, sensor histidine kinase and response regulator
MEDRESSVEELKEIIQDLRTRLELSDLELDSFIYSVSHDFRAPLRAIDGFSRILLEDFEKELPEEAKNYLAILRKNADQLNNLVNSLVEYSRLNRRPVEKRRVQATRLVGDIIDNLKEKESGIEFEIRELPDSTGDHQLLRHVFENLISNAVKFTSKNQERRVEVGSFKEDGHNVFYVKDNGDGFDMRYAEKIFGVFQRLHSPEEYEGSGMGLATVKRIIHRHNGKVWIESEPKKGTTVYFSLPNIDPPVERPLS